MGWYEDFQALMKRDNTAATSGGTASQQQSAPQQQAAGGRQLPDLQRIAFQGTPQFPTPAIQAQQGEAQQQAAAGNSGFGLASMASLNDYAKAGGADTETLLGGLDKDWSQNMIDATKAEADAYQKAMRENAAIKAALEKMSGQYGQLLQNQQSMADQLKNAGGGQQVDPSRIALAIDNGWTGNQSLDSFEWFKNQKSTPYVNQNTQDFIARMLNSGGR